MKVFTSFCVAVLMTVTVSAQNAPKGLNLNEKAPDFSARDQYGKNISLSNELKKGAVVLVFYRGQWCPYCNRQLKQLEDSVSLIQQKGATVVTITPEVQENIQKTITKTKASYSILHDEGLRIMKSYDVAFKVDDKTIETYKKYGIDFLTANGQENGANLPVPAVYVINQEGRIIYKHFDTDYRKRASVKEILSHL
ncbi:MAG: AhpC/TSA family protein [Bacteroidota bacterium]|nr:AhpC/TSA family protein [Bacteroidota bacterium]